MTKSKSQVNDEKPVTEKVQAAESQGGEPDADEVIDGDGEPDEPAPDMVEETEEDPVPAATAAPLMNHGTHNAAVNGLQTSPGYDPSKL